MQTLRPIFNAYGHTSRVLAVLIDGEGDNNSSLSLIYFLQTPHDVTF